MATATPLTATATRLRLRSTITRLQHTVTERWHRPRQERPLYREPGSGLHSATGGFRVLQLRAWLLGRQRGLACWVLGALKTRSSDSLAHRIVDRNGARTTALSESGRDEALTPGRAR